MILGARSPEFDPFVNRVLQTRTGREAGHERTNGGAKVKTSFAGKICAGLLAAGSVFAADTGPCGLSGTIEQRTSNCAETKNDWALVTRTAHGAEVWREPETGLLWGDIANNVDEKSEVIGANWKEAKNLCARSGEYNGNLEGLEFKLPTAKEYKAADRHGIRKTLPRMTLLFWTSTKMSVGDWINDGYIGYKGAKVYWSYYGNIESWSVTNEALVRCVAKPLIVEASSKN